MGPLRPRLGHPALALLLAVALMRWMDDANLKWSAVAGLLLGLTALLKAEIFLAAVLMTVGAVILGGDIEDEGDTNADRLNMRAVRRCIGQM